MKSISKKLALLDNFIIFNYVVIIIGLALRIGYYFHNYSLHIDESSLILQLIPKSYFQILLNIDYVKNLPIKPVGFMVVEKWIMNNFGFQEYKLRIFSLICSMLSLILFYPFSRQYLKGKARTLALSLFAFAPTLIIYSAIVKHYACDVLSSIVLIMLFNKILNEPKNIKLIVFLVISGFIFILFSYASFFIMLSIIILSLIFYVQKMQKNLLVLFASSVLVWANEMYVLFATNLKYVKDNSSLKEMCKPWLMPRDISEAFYWIKASFLEMFSSTMGINFKFLALVLLIIGIYEVLRKNNFKGWILILPIGLVFLSSVFREYPFNGRFILFIAPMLAIFISSAIFFLINKVKYFKLVFAAIIISMIMFYPVMTSINYALIHQDPSEFKEIIKYFKENYKKGDVIFMNNSAQYGFGYYHGLFKITNDIKLIGKIVDDFSDDPKGNYGTDFRYLEYDKNGYLIGYKSKYYERLNLLKDLNTLKNNKRIWYIFSHASDNYKKLILKDINKLGGRVDVVKGKGASVYLYDLSKNYKD